MTQRALILVGLVVVGLAAALIVAYDIVKVEWISFMEIQQSYRPMEEPLPPPPDSVPVEGAAFLPGLPAEEVPKRDDSNAAKRKPPASGPGEP